MAAPAGMRQSKYIRALTEALGWKTNLTRTREALQQAHIYPYFGREKDALEFFVSQGHDLSHYTALADDAKTFIEQRYGKTTHHTSLVVRQHQLALPSSPLPEKESAWDRRLISRLARLITNARDDAEQKLIARTVLKDGGYPKPKKGTWDDEARALKIFTAAGISINGFEYLHPDERAVTHIPPETRKRLHPQLELEIGALQEEIHGLTMRLRITEMRMSHGVSLLDQAVREAYESLRKRQQLDPAARLTDAELLADLAHRQFLKKAEER